MVCSPETLFRRSGVRRLPMRAGPEHTRLPGVRGEEGGGRGEGGLILRLHLRRHLCRVE